MSHKIKVSDTNDITLEVHERKEEFWLNIYKTVFSDRYTGVAKDNALAFSFDQAKELNNIIQSIDAGNYELRDYGEFQKWYKVFKIYVSSFRGVNSLQVREWVDSNNYTGYGKQWISIPAHKIKELQGHLNVLIKEFTDIMSGEKQVATVVTKQPVSEGNNSDIDDYF